MVRSVQCARLEEPVVDVARRMRDEGLGFMPVCDEQRRACGVITDLDLAVRALAMGELGSSSQDVMTPVVISCLPEDDVSRALELMREHQTSRVLVTSPRGVPLGVVSLSDLARVPAGPPVTPRARNEGMLEELSASGITDVAIRGAVAAVPRDRFLPGIEDAGYGDMALLILPEATIPEPLEVARTLAATGIAPGDRVLVTGRACAYTTAVLAAFGAEVYVVEPDLAEGERIIELLNGLGLDAEVFVAEPDRGLPEQQAFDAILLGKTAAIPDALLDQLGLGGSLILEPPGNRAMIRVQRVDEALYSRQILGPS